MYNFWVWSLGWKIIRLKFMALWFFFLDIGLTEGAPNSIYLKYWFKRFFFLCRLIDQESYCKFWWFIKLYLMINDLNIYKNDLLTSGGRIIYREKAEINSRHTISDFFPFFSVTGSFLEEKYIRKSFTIISYILNLK